MVVPLSQVVPNFAPKNTAMNNITKSIADKRGLKLHNNPRHPICMFKEHVQKFFVGYEIFDSLPEVVTVKDNFDDLLIPADHPGRSLNDTYYLDEEHVLRSHTSAHQNQLLRSGHMKFLATGDVYRKDTIDRTLYPVFHQMEGVKILPKGADDLMDLKTFLTEGHASETCSHTGDASRESCIPALLTYLPRMNPLRSTAILRFMPFTFIGVETVVALTVAPLDALRVKCHNRRCGALSAFATYLHDEFFYTVTLIPFCPPLAEIPVHDLPFRKVVWKHTPLASADQKIQDGLEYGAQGIFTVSAIIFKEYFVYIRPLTLGQMCLIEADFMHTNLFSSTNTLIESLLCLLTFNLV